MRKRRRTHARTPGYTAAPPSEHGAHAQTQRQLVQPGARTVHDGRRHVVVGRKAHAEILPHIIYKLLYLFEY